MPATPAWPPTSLARLYVAEPLSAGAIVALDPPQSNYLVKVLRLGEGAQLKLFDDSTGEWLAELARAHRKAAEVRIVGRLRLREAVPDLWLAFAPIKHGRIEWLVEKATELGIARLIPVITERTVARTVKIDRLRAHIIEAAEQCERTALAELAEPVSLTRLLADWPADRTLLFADERGGGGPPTSPAPAGLLVGPEGGFTEGEATAIAALPPARRVSLGARILRADTAALAAIAAWMAAAGDWQR